MAGLAAPKAFAADPVTSPLSVVSIDGSPEAYTLAMAYGQASLGDIADLSSMSFTSTDDAYRRLIVGDADLILVPAPTTSQLDAAREAGMDLEVIPLATEGFFFLVGADNPVTSLSQTQLRQIYSGAITDWAQVGGTPGPITAYQQRSDSASQAAMTDLVMGATAMAPAPLQRTPGPTGPIDAPAIFTGQDGAIGYAYGYYVNAIWSDWTDLEGQGIHLIGVDGVAPSASAVQSGRYPLTSSLAIVIDHADASTSPARVLAQSLLSAQGRSVTERAGFQPLGSPVTATATPDVPAAISSSPSELASDGQTFDVNPVTVTWTTELVSARTDTTAIPHCAQVQRARISGLADTDVENALMATFRDRQDAYLKQAWGTDRLSSGQACLPTGDMASLRSTPVTLTLSLSVEADFGNVLSLVSVPSGATSGPSPVAAVLNARLDTGADLSLADLFSDGANLAAMVQADSVLDERAVMSWVLAHRVGEEQPFSFTSSSATIDEPDGTQVVIDFASQWPEVAIYDLVPADPGVYDGTGTVVTCPVLTRYADGVCWTDDGATLASADTGSAGAAITVHLPLDAQDRWQVTGVPAGVVAAPEPSGGVGPATMRIHLAANGDAASRSLAIKVAVTDPATHTGYSGYVVVDQAGLLPPAPQVDTANARIVAGALPEPVDPTWTLRLTWPDATVSAPVPVAPDGSWSAPTPAGMASGPVTATGVGPQGDGPDATAWLDTTIPNAPVIQTANSSIVSGTSDPGVTITLTWPDHSVVHVTPRSGQWMAPTPPGAQSGVVTAVAVDAAGNPSVARSVPLVTARPSAPVVHSATAARIEGSAPGVVGVGWTVSVRGSGGALIGSAPVDATGAWSLDVPRGVMEHGATVQLTTADQAGNLSDPTIVEVPEPVVDPQGSTLVVTSDPIQVTIPPCWAAPEISTTEVTAQATILDTAGRAVPAANVRFSVAGPLVAIQPEATTDDDGVANLTAVVDLGALLAGGRPEVSAQVLVDGVWRDLADSPVEVPMGLVAVPMPSSAPVATVSQVGDAPVPADGATAYQVSVDWIDGCGTPVAGLDVGFQVDGAAALTSGTATLDGQGHADVLVTDRHAETVALQAWVTLDTGQTIPVEQTPQDLVFRPGTPDAWQSSLAVESQVVTIPCDRPGATTVSVQVKDQAGRPLSDAVVRLSVDGEATVSSASVTTDESGVASATVADQTSETVTVSAQVVDGGVLRPLAGSPVAVTFLPGCAPPDPSTLSYSMTQGVRLANGVDAYTVTIYARDVNGGRVTGLVSDLGVTTTGTQVAAPLVDNGDGTYTATIVSHQVGIFPVRVTFTGADHLVRDLVDSPAHVTFIPAWSSTLSTSVTPDPLAAVGDGLESYILTASVVARVGGSASAPLTGQGSLISAAITSSGGADPGVGADVQITDFTETQPGTYSARLTAPVAGTYEVVVTWLEPGMGTVSTSPILVTSAMGASSTSMSTTAEQAPGISRNVTKHR